PEDIKIEVYNYIKENFRGEWKEDMTEQQFIYKTRKKAFGPFKRTFWELPTEVKEKILAALYQKFHLLFEKLNVFNTRQYVEKYINPIKILPSKPEGL
ncbi:MAG: aldolase, partial [Candidatus Desulfofervidaceae bacterium]|nr:aldolase [Candidatus Desulfofervidaceae bacterium]